MPDRCPIQPRLPGLMPTARISFTAYLMPDGLPSHYEVEGRSPEGSLTYYRAQAGTQAVSSDPAYQESLAYFAGWLLEAALDLAAADQALQRTEPPSES